MLLTARRCEKKRKIHTPLEKGNFFSFLLWVEGNKSARLWRLLLPDHQPVVSWFVYVMHLHPDREMRRWEQKQHQHETPVAEVCMRLKHR